MNIEDRLDPGSPIYIVATDSQVEVEALEDAARKVGLEAIVRHSDSATAALTWMLRNDPARTG